MQLRAVQPFFTVSTARLPPDRPRPHAPPPSLLGMPPPPHHHTHTPARVQESLSLSHAVSIALNALYQPRLAFVAGGGGGGGALPGSATLAAAAAGQEPAGPALELQPQPALAAAGGYAVNRTSGIVASTAAAA